MPRKNTLKKSKRTMAVNKITVGKAIFGTKYKKKMIFFQGLNFLLLNSYRLRSRNR